MMLINKKRFFVFLFIICFIISTGICSVIKPWENHSVNIKGNINVNGNTYEYYSNLTYDGVPLLGSTSNFPIDLTNITNGETKVFYHEFSGSCGEAVVFRYLIKINTTFIDYELKKSVWEGFNITVSRGQGGNYSVPTHEFYIENSCGHYGINITYKANKDFVYPGENFPFNLTYEIMRL